MDGWKSPGGRRYRAPYGANKSRFTRDFERDNHFKYCSQFFRLNVDKMCYFVTSCFSFVSVYLAKSFHISKVMVLGHWERMILHIRIYREA